MTTFEEIAMPHYDTMYRVALDLCAGNTQLAEDVVQETYLKAFRNFESFDSSRGSIRTWLTAIMKRRLYDFTGEAWVRHVDCSDQLLETEEADAFDVVSFSQLVEQLKETLVRASNNWSRYSKTTAERRMVVFDKLLLGDTIREIAVELGIDYKAVYDDLRAITQVVKPLLEAALRVEA